MLSIVGYAVVCVTVKSCTCEKVHIRREGACYMNM